MLRFRRKIGSLSIFKVNQFTWFIKRQFSNTDSLDIDNKLDDRKVTIRNVSLKTTIETLGEMLFKVGKIKKMQFTSPSVCEVIYQHADEAYEAVSMFHYTMLDGCLLDVRSEPPNELEVMLAASPIRPNYKLRFNNIANNINEQELCDHIRSVGCEVLTVDFDVHPDLEAARAAQAVEEFSLTSTATVMFSSIAQAKLVLDRLHNTYFEGRRLQVEYVSWHTFFPAPIPVPPAEDVHLNTDTTVFVSHLPYEAHKVTVQEHFSTVGVVVDVKVLTDRKGRCNGSAVVTFDSVEAANSALLTINNSIFGSALLRVRSRAEYEERLRMDAEGPGDSEEGLADLNKILVDNLPRDVVHYDFRTPLAVLLPSVDEIVMRPMYGTSGNRQALITFQQPLDALFAVQNLDRTKYKGHVLRVRHFKRKLQY